MFSGFSSRRVTGCLGTVLARSCLPWRVSRVSLSCYHQTAPAMASDKLKPARKLEGLDKNVWVEFSALAAQTKATNLGQGFPDFSPPQFVIDALVECTKTPLMHQYTRSQGHPRLVKALAKLFSTFHGREIDAMSEVIVTHGAYTALAHAIRAFLEPGDEVVLIEPFFDCYVPMAKMVGATVVYVPIKPQGRHPGSSRDFALDMKEFEAAFTPNTKMMIINNPQNPFGKVFSREELETIADVCRRHDVICVSDEVYEWLVYDSSEFVRIASLPGMWERTITIGSAGKTFSATGWKTGWSIGPEYLIKHMQTINAATGYTMVTPLQEAIGVGLEVETARLGAQDSYFKELPRSLERKRDEMATVLREVGFDPIIPEGGYFMMADTSGLGVSFNDDSDEAYDFKLAKWMIREKGIAAIPPTAFYSPGHAQLGEKLMRFCFCKDDSTLQEAYKRLRKWAEERRQ